MKKYAIYLAYAPEVDLRNQGLGRLLAYIIKGAVDGDIKLIMAYPKWYEEQLDKLLLDHDIALNSVERITTAGVPILIRIKRKIDGYSKRKSSFLSGIKQKFRLLGNKLAKLFVDWLATSNIFLFTLMSLLIILFFVPVIMPFFVLGTIFLLLGTALKKIRHHNKLRFLFVPIYFLKRNILAHQIFDRVRKVELNKLNKKINAYKGLDAVLIPTLFWPEVSGIHLKKVVVAPDIIFYDFPIQYNAPVFERVNNRLVSTIAAADHLITYSHYVKDAHIQKFFEIDEGKISVIPHGASDLSDYLDNEDALSIIEEYQEKNLANHDYLKSFIFKNIKYIFYSSQIRPHKNFLNLLKAYKTVLREKYVGVKLITTANLKDDPGVWRYVTQHRLQNDIICLHNVPSNVLAALNARAICAINPTLFEGGFPFTFMEAYSVGTPSIMSNIPMTAEFVVDNALRDMMLFDPFSVGDMAEKIEWAVNNADQLFEEQKGLYGDFMKRTWSNVALDYIRVLDNVSSI
jgi:glycosyltransferase involved in cell wall biosynthesis